MVIHAKIPTREEILSDTKSYIYLACFVHICLDLLVGGLLIVVLKMVDDYAYTYSVGHVSTVLAWLFIVHLIVVFSLAATKSFGFLLGFVFYVVRFFSVLTKLAAWPFHFYLAPHYRRVLLSNGTMVGENTSSVLGSIGHSDVTVEAAISMTNRTTIDGMAMDNSTMLNGTLADVYGISVAYATDKYSFGHFIAVLWLLIVLLVLQALTVWLFCYLWQDKKVVVRRVVVAETA